MIKKWVLSPVQSTAEALVTKVAVPYALGVARALRVALYGLVVAGVNWALTNYVSLHLDPVYAFALLTVLVGVDKYLRAHKEELAGED